MNASNPRRSALLGMGVSSALHFSAYELSRSAILTFFTSSASHFSWNHGALSFATGCIGPVSVVFLWAYTNLLEIYGPRIALRNSTIFSVSSLLLGYMIIQYVEWKYDAESDWLRSLSKLCVFALFVIQNALVQLLFTQHWAFIGSMAQQKHSSSQNFSSWIAPVAGMGSLASTLAASAVGPLADYVSLSGLLVFASILLTLSGIAADWSYSIAEKSGLGPLQEPARDLTESKFALPSKSLWKRTSDLVHRVPILGVLCVEVMLCQCLSAVITYLFMRQVKLEIEDDQLRARWTGNCYAWINGISGVLQFLVIPLITPLIDLLRLWPMMPLIMLSILIPMSLEPLDKNGPSLTLVAAAFCTMKILEYSLRGVSNEMLFATLDYESRYVAKQEIALVANRLAKSGTAAALSWLTASNTTSISWIANVIAAMWCAASISLSQMNQIKRPKEKEI